MGPLKAKTKRPEAEPPIIKSHVVLVDIKKGLGQVVAFQFLFFGGTLKIKILFPVICANDIKHCYVVFVKTLFLPKETTIRYIWGRCYEHIFFAIFANFR
jgi:hypothetical protein